MDGWVDGRSQKESEGSDLIVQSLSLQHARGLDMGTNKWMDGWMVRPISRPTNYNSVVGCGGCAVMAGAACCLSVCRSVCTCYDCQWSLDDDEMLLCNAVVSSSAPVSIGHLFVSHPATDMHTSQSVAHTQTSTHSHTHRGGMWFVDGWMDDCVVRCTISLNDLNE